MFLKNHGTVIHHHLKQLTRRLSSNNNNKNTNWKGGRPNITLLHAAHNFLPIKISVTEEESSAQILSIYRTIHHLNRPNMVYHSTAIFVINHHLLSPCYSFSLPPLLVLLSSASLSPSLLQLSLLLTTNFWGFFSIFSSSPLIDYFQPDQCFSSFARSLFAS